MAGGERGTAEFRSDIGKARASFGKRVFEWFWRGEALGAWRKSLPQPADRTLALAERARATADVALVALTVPESLGPVAEAIASELYRQSAYWSLCAQFGSVASERTPSQYSEGVWDRLDEQVLVPLVADPDARVMLRTRLSAGTFVDFSELSAHEMGASCAALRGLAAELLARVEERTRANHAIRAQRAWRVGALLLCLVSVIVGPVLLHSDWQDRHDLAAGAPWRTSSSYDGGGCVSPEQQCAAANGWFFHTNEADKDSWIEFALAGESRISTVLVVNRQDCCAERAVPLVVEVSDDRKHWRSVAERRNEFSRWRASFPTAQARWLRLRLLRPGPLHLARVRIFP